jgi:hypothetical protein
VDLTDVNASDHAAAMDTTQLQQRQRTLSIDETREVATRIMLWCCAINGCTFPHCSNSDKVGPCSERQLLQQEGSQIMVPLCMAVTGDLRMPSKRRLTGLIQLLTHNQTRRCVYHAMLLSKFVKRSSGLHCISWTITHRSHRGTLQC